MADMAQAIVTGGMGVAGVTIGAGLTYWLGALNRRYQEAREDRTRWYEKQLQAYTEFSTLAFDGITLSAQDIQEASYEEHVAHLRMLVKACFNPPCRLSPEVIERAKQVMSFTSDQLRDRGKLQKGSFGKSLRLFEAAARKDLEHEPSQGRK